MQFKPNHSPGSWVSAGGYHLISAITQVPTMLEYMMDRAKILDQTINTIHANGMIRPTRHEDEELQTIMAILKDAGVEVVE